MKTILQFLCSDIGTVRRFLVATTTGLWLGGFTFYSGIVIHVGAEVLGDHRPVGFITQEVSRWLNLAGAVALAALLWNMVATWGTQPRLRKACLAATWAAMTAGLAALVVLHLFLDRHLDRASQEIVEYNQFLWLHRAYLAISTAQWGAGLCHVWLLMLPRSDSPAEASS
jgi:hypothetical protein